MAQVIKSDAGEQSRTSMAGVLKLKDLAVQARQIVLDARKDAARIVTEAREKASAVEQDARDRGYAEGLLQGREEGIQAGRQEAMNDSREHADGELLALVELVKKIAAELSAAKASVIAQAKRDMLGFSLDLTEKIVSHVKIYDLAAAKANLAKALEMAGGTGKMTIKVNPAQLDALQRHCGDLVSAMNIRGELGMVGDENIERGGVKVLTSGGEIDATISTQMNNVVAALLGRCDDDANWVSADSGQYIS